MGMDEQLSEESEILGGTSADGRPIKPGRWLHEDRVGRDTAEAYRLGVLEGRADAAEDREDADVPYEYAVRCTIEDLPGTEPTVHYYMQNVDRAKVENWLADHRSDTARSEKIHTSVLVRRPVIIEWEEV